MKFRVHYEWDGEKTKIDLDAKDPNEANKLARRRIATNIRIIKTKVLKDESA